MSTSAPITRPLNSEPSNIPTPLSMMPSSSLSPASQNERFEVDNAEEMIEVDAAQKLSSLGKEVDKEEGKELEQKDTTCFNPTDFQWVGIIPLLGTPGVPYFSGANVSDFYT